MYNFDSHTTSQSQYYIINYSTYEFIVQEKQNLKNLGKIITNLYSTKSQITHTP